MGKRKKSSFDDGSDDGRKRKKYDLSDQLQELYELLRNYKTSAGKVVCETFIRAPKRRSLPEFYEVVSTPIDLLRIQQKIRMDEYDDLTQFNKDIELLVNNAKSYYRPDTAEYSDAVKLWEKFIEFRNDIFGGGESSKTLDSGDDEASNSNMEGGSNPAESLSGNSESENDDNAIFEDLFSSVMTATSDDGRQLSSMFELLPSKTAYPDYYEVITEPIDLKMIASKIQQNEYTNLNDLDNDLQLMIRNARSYNAPGSQIYKDANNLKKVIQAKKSEIDVRRPNTSKSSQRIRAKRVNPFQPKWSAITASLKYQDSDDEEGDGFDEGTNDDTMNLSDSESAESNPQWLMYNALKDTPHSEQFFRLPSKRHYPDYYKEIKQPMSLSQISAKIKTNCYENISSLVDDLTLVFDNAMSYNRPDSKIYKDAAKLKKILQMKEKEIVNVFKDEGDEEDEDDQKVSKVVARSAGSRTTRKSSKSMVNAMSQELKNVRRSQKADGSQLKKRMRILYKTLIDYSDDEERYLIDPFMDKPSKKLYPDYYAVIQNPMDMKTIDSNIKNDVYQSEESLLADFRTMFENCRLYNEDNSQIYQDAVNLENALSRKLRELGPLPLPVEKPKKERVRPSSGTQLKIKTLYETVRDYTDQKGRLLSAIFVKLPSRADFPDYFEVIRKPISLEKIGSRVKNCIYETVEDLLSDIILMLDNACKYNEPDSQIFKDALTLQQVALQTKIDLNDDSVNGIPDVKIIVQDLLTNLFISVYNHQDEEGRCFSDSINELTELGDKNSEVELRTLNFDLIKRNLNQGRYRRMDRFQQDMFEVFERARRISRTDSQAFEDSIELQQYFITLRNELCKNGDLLQTGALQYDHATLQQHIDILRHEKVPKEINEEDVKMTDDSGLVGSAGPGAMAMPPANAAASSTALMMDNAETMVSYGSNIYNVGDFVYVASNEKNMEPHIVYIEKFKRDPLTEQTMVFGCWFYRPHETFHIPTRRFLEKEVFKTDSYTSRPISQVLGKCCVMFVKDYFRQKPVGFADQDVYVCESRYSCKGKSFKKIKIWTYELIASVLRDVPLEMNRVPSVFKDQSITAQGILEKTIEDELLEQELMAEDDDQGNSSIPKILDVPRPNVLSAPPNDGTLPDGNVYYDQFSIPAGTFRVGDCCYVRTDQERNLICRIDRMWVDHDGNPYFHGPWYVQQAELPVNTLGSFYPQEVFLSSIEDTNPLLSICERCAVLDVNDYILKRPTEFLEKDVYVCEIRYLEHEKKFEPLPEEGILKIVHQNYSVVRDEWYFFRKPLVLQKDSYQLPQVLDDLQQQQMYNGAMMMDGQMVSNATPRPSIDMEMNDESNMSSISGAGLQLGPSAMLVHQPGLMDAHQLVTGPPIQHIQAAPATPAQAPPPPPATTSTLKKPKTPKRLVTGYIIFASEVRKSVVEANPDCSFGDISRLIGAQWKLLVQEQKTEYERRAAKQNAEMKEQNAAEAALLQQFGPPPGSPAVTADTHVINGVFECHWEHKCDYQFEDVNDLFEHLTSEPSGHVWVSYADTKDKEPGEFQCMFHGCGRVKKGAPPFPSVPRLIRHCKEVHINKAVAKIVDPEKRSKNYVPSSKKVQEATIAQITQQQQKIAQVQGQTIVVQPHLVQQPGVVQAQPQQLQQVAQQVAQVPGTPTHVIPQIQQHQAGQTIHHPQGQIQTIQIAGPGGHPNTIQVMTTQSGQQTAFLQSSQLMGHATIGGQTIQIQQGQPTVVSSLPQQVHFAPAPQQQVQPQQTGPTLHIKPQQTMCLPQNQQPYHLPHQQSALQQQLQSGAMHDSIGPVVPHHSQQQQQQSISTLHPTLTQAISSIPNHDHFFQSTNNGSGSLPIMMEAGQAVQVKPVEPLFMAPPKTNRLAHTHTYMKYIESLKPEKRYITNWEKQLSAAAPETQPTTNGHTNGSGSNGSVDPKLNGWLQNNPNGSNEQNSGPLVNALWALRNFMMKDALDLASM